MSKESIQGRADVLAVMADFQRLLDSVAVETLETELMASNVAVARLVTQVEALIESGIATLNAKGEDIRVRFERGDAVDPAELAALQRELEIFGRMLASNTGLILSLKWPVRLLNLMPAVAATGGLAGEVAPLPDYLLFPGGTV